MKLRLANRADWQRCVRYIQSLPWTRDGHKLQYRLSIAEIKSKRSLKQNTRYWTLLTTISQQAPSHMEGEWYSPDAWHEYAKKRFIGMEPGPFDVGVPKSSAKLGVERFGEYVDEVEAWAYQRFDGFDFSYEEEAA